MIAKRRAVQLLAAAAMTAGLVLTAGAANAATTAPGRAASTAQAGSQRTYGIPKTSYTTWWMNNDHTGRCIDDSAAYGLRAIGCNGLNYQAWY